MAATQTNEQIKVGQGEERPGRHGWVPGASHTLAPTSLVPTCLMSSGLLSMWLISGFRSISCCIWGLAMIMWRIRSGLDIMSWTSGFSMICDSISGLDISCLCICCCSSMKLAEPRPRLPRPRMPPKPAAGRGQSHSLPQEPFPTWSEPLSSGLQDGPLCFLHLPFPVIPAAPALIHCWERCQPARLSPLWRQRLGAGHSPEHREGNH